MRKKIKILIILCKVIVIFLFFKEFISHKNLLMEHAILSAVVYVAAIIACGLISVRIVSGSSAGWESEKFTTQLKIFALTAILFILGKYIYKMLMK